MIICTEYRSKFLRVETGLGSRLSGFGYSSMIRVTYVERAVAPIMSNHRHWPASRGKRVGRDDRVESDHGLGLATEEQDGRPFGQVGPVRASIFRP